jgi:hypothetical protein
MSILANRPAKAKTSRKPRKVVRTVRFGLAPFEGNPGIIDITVSGKTTSYFVRNIPSDFGRGFSLEKTGPQDGEVYHVLLEEDGRSCDCKGFTRHGHCKHPDALLKLVQLGKL